MNEREKRRKPFDIGSLIGWIIFGLVIAGGPILGALQNLLGGVRLPSYFLPLLIGGLVVLSVVVSAVRALGGGRSADTRLPTETRAPPYRPQTPMPPFGGDMGLPGMPGIPHMSAPSPAAEPHRQSATIPKAPRFEPIVSPAVLALGVVGLLGLGLLAIVVLS